MAFANRHTSRSSKETPSASRVQRRRPKPSRRSTGPATCSSAHRSRTTSRRIQSRMVQPGRWHAEVQRLKSFTNIATASLPQLAMAEFLDRAGWTSTQRAARGAVAIGRSIAPGSAAIVSRGHARQPAARRIRSLDPITDWPRQHRDSSQALAAGINILSDRVLASTQYRNCIRIACGYPFEVLKPQSEPRHGDRRERVTRLVARWLEAGGWRLEASSVRLLALTPRRS